MLAMSESTSRLVQALRQSRIPSLRKIRVEASGAGVILTGRVSSYYLKQLAQEAVLPLLRDERLENHVTVVRP